MIDTDRCLRTLVTPTSWQWVRLYRHYSNGHLPHAGGILDQPARFADAMEVIDDQTSKG